MSEPRPAVPRPGDPGGVAENTVNTENAKNTENTVSTVSTENVENVEYRVAHLRDRLAAEELGELGVRAEVRAGAVVVTGTVPSAQCRETLLRTVHEELAGLAVHTDVVVADNASPDHAEELS